MKDVLTVLAVKVVIVSTFKNTAYYSEGTCKHHVATWLYYQIFVPHLGAFFVQGIKNRFA